MPRMAWLTMAFLLSKASRMLLDAKLSRLQVPGRRHDTMVDASYKDLGAIDRKRHHGPATYVRMHI